MLLDMGNAYPEHHKLFSYTVIIPQSILGSHEFICTQLQHFSVFGYLYMLFGSLEAAKQ